MAKGPDPKKLEEAGKVIRKLVSDGQKSQNFGIALAKKADELMSIQVSKTKEPKALLLAARKETKNQKGTLGTVQLEDSKLAFRCQEEVPSGLLRLLKAHVRRCGASAKITVFDPSGVELKDSKEDGEESEATEVSAQSEEAEEQNENFDQGRFDQLNTDFTKAHVSTSKLIPLVEGLKSDLDNVENAFKRAMGSNPSDLTGAEEHLNDMARIKSTAEQQAKEAIKAKKAGSPDAKAALVNAFKKLKDAANKASGENEDRQTEIAAITQIFTAALRKNPVDERSAKAALAQLKPLTKPVAAPQPEQESDQQQNQVDEAPQQEEQVAGQPDNQNDQPPPLADGPLPRIEANISLDQPDDWLDQSNALDELANSTDNDATEKYKAMSFDAARKRWVWHSGKTLEQIDALEAGILKACEGQPGIAKVEPAFIKLRNDISKIDDAMTKLLSAGDTAKDNKDWHQKRERTVALATKMQTFLSKDPVLSRIPQNPFVDVGQVLALSSVAEGLDKEVFSRHQIVPAD